MQTENGLLRAASCALTCLVAVTVAAPGDEPRPAEMSRATAEPTMLFDRSSSDAAQRPDSGTSTCSELSATAATSIGPDLIVGHVFSCAVLGRVGPMGSGTSGMSCWTTACTIGDEGTEWFGLPSTNHPMICVNLYRQWRRDGSDRLEQIGRGWIKHGFATENHDDCGFGCTPGNDFLNGPGCSDTYAAGQFQACDLGPRSMINPYTGVMPPSSNLGSSGGCALNYLSNDHRDHVHNAISHRVQVQDVDLFSSSTFGARFVSEGQYIVSHEFRDGNGTQNNNVSHRRVLASGPGACGDVAFTDQGPTLATSPAIDAWTGASQTLIEPAPLVDGRGFLVYKVTPLGGIWRYEYALYNMNMDRSFGSLSIPLPAGAVVSNVGSHFPLNHAAEPHTENYSNTAWAVSTSGGAVTWSTDTFVMDPFANAVRWGTMYNFYFDANTPPTSAAATVGLFKTGATVNAATLAPGAGPVDCNINGIEDRCDISCALPGCAVEGCGTKTDCNANLVPDTCEPDCNGNGTADRCDIAANPTLDCDANAIPDTCEPFTDCNGNLIRDACEVYADPSLDLDLDGILDDCTPPLSRLWFVDDDSPGDPWPGYPYDSDPLENGSLAHPFDAIQEAINAASPGDIVVVRDGVYRGFENWFLSFQGKAITVRSQNGPQQTVVDLEFWADFAEFYSGEASNSRLEGFQVINVGTGSNAPAAITCWQRSRPTISNCRFSATGVGTAGIRMFEHSPAVITHCRFDNLITAIQPYNSSPLISNCVIRGGNVGISLPAGDGSTDCENSANPHIVNTTITGCVMGMQMGFETFADVDNSILWGNTSAQIQALGGPSTAAVSFSDVQGGWGGAGNINADPLFVNASLGDFRLSSGSPCIDAGDNGVDPLPATDQEGGTRLFNRPGTPDTGIGSPPIVDRGADEWTDCNGNGIDDSIDIDSFFSGDCNRNRVPDSCETVVDCNGNTVNDTCDIALGTAPDCNVNGVPDGCDLSSSTSQDCSGNGIPNECERDCQPNGVPDDCDISGGFSMDAEPNGIPDECQPPPNILADPNSELSFWRTSRALTVQVTPATASGGIGTSALQIEMVDLQHPNPRNRPANPPPNFTAFDTGLNGVCSGATTNPNYNGHHCDTDADCLGSNSAITTDDGTCGSLLGCAGADGCVRWVGPVVTFREKQGVPSLGTYQAARLQCSPYYTDWTAVGQFSVFGAEIIPSSTYVARTFGTSCKGTESICANVSPSVTLVTRRSGDVASPWNPPDTGDQPTGGDVGEVLNKFKGSPGSPSNVAALIFGNLPDPNTDVGGQEIGETVNAFKGLAYSFSGPCECPSTVPCGATACSSTDSAPCGAGLCVITCVGGDNAGLPCRDFPPNAPAGHCPGGSCPTTGFCRDRCGRCN